MFDESIVCCCVSVTLPSRVGDYYYHYCMCTCARYYSGIVSLSCSSWASIDAANGSLVHGLLKATFVSGTYVLEEGNRTYGE